MCISQDQIATLCPRAGTQLSGRYMEMKMLPFPFGILSAFPRKTGLTKSEWFNLYMELTLSLCASVKTSAKKRPGESLRTYLHTVLLKDVVTRFAHCRCEYAGKCDEVLLHNNGSRFRRPDSGNLKSQGRALTKKQWIGKFGA